MRNSSATYGEVFAVREYRFLFGAHLLSLVGDQLTAVALAFLAYSLSGSTTLAALAFAGSYVAWIAGGPLLAGLADRYPRRRVMVGCDLLRAALVLVMVVPGVPAAALVALAFAANLLRPPFAAARAALLPDVLDGDRYTVANGLDNLLAQGAQVLGFAGAGFLVSMASPRTALLVDAATFVLSALLLLAGVKPRPAAAARTGTAGEGRSGFRAGLTVVFGDRRLRSYVLLFWLASLTYAAEGLAAPLAGQYGGQAHTGGLLLAAAPLGMVLGGVVLTRACGPALRERLIVPLALASCLVLVPLAARPPLPVLLGLLALAGFAGGFSIPLNAMFGRAVPAAYRARAFGVAMAGVCAAQGLAIVAAGLLAEVVAPTTVVAGIAAVAALGVGAAALSWPHASGRGTRGTVPALALAD